MMRDITVVKKYCSVNDLEENLLTGIRKPIVILNQINKHKLAESVVPNQKTLGVMLPYTQYMNCYLWKI